MPTKLQILLEQIHPSRTLDNVAAKVDRAVNSFRGARGKVTDFHEYQELIGRFHAHVEAEVLQMREPMYDGYPEMHWGRASTLLSEVWGPEGWKTGFEMSRTGVEGGFRQVLSTLAERMALLYARNEIQARVSAFWSEASPDEWLSASEEYVAKFGHLLPSELTEGGAWRIKSDFQDVLNEHPFMLRRLSRLGR